MITTLWVKMINTRESRHSGKKADVYALIKGFPLIVLTGIFGKIQGHSKDDAHFK